MFRLKCLSFSQVQSNLFRSRQLRGSLLTSHSILFSLVADDEATNKAYLPERVLGAVSDAEESPFFHFEVAAAAQESDGSDRRRRLTHCGVQEFTAEDGFIYLPDWLMAQLGVSDHGLVGVTRVFLKKGVYAKFVLHCEVDQGEVDLGQSLEAGLRRFACLTLNDAPECLLSGIRTVVVVKEVRPGGPRRAIDILDLDLTVDVELAERGFSERAGLPDPLYRVPGQRDEPSGRADGLSHFQGHVLRFWRTTPRAGRAFRPFCGRGRRLSDDAPADPFRRHRVRLAPRGEAAASTFPGVGRRLEERDADEKD